MSVLAVVAAPSLMSWPLETPGGNPVIAVPGLSPSLPLTMVSPVLVMVDAAKTPYAPAVPKVI